MNWMENLLEFAISYGSKVVSALLIFIIGKWLIKRLMEKIQKWSREKLDSTLQPFVKSILVSILYVLLFITIASTLGIQMSSFIALFGAAGLAVGLALQGSLSNFAGGILILTIRPINVGDFIEVNDLKGKVDSIKILYTTLLTLDNRKIFIPNGNLSNSNIINYSAQATRRVELVFGIGYDDDFNRAKEILRKIVEEHSLILTEPEPLIRVAEHAGSSINIRCFVWSKSEDYWEVYYDLLEDVKTAFDREGINIPYPQMDVHIDN